MPSLDATTIVVFPKPVLLKTLQASWEVSSQEITQMFLILQGSEQLQAGLRPEDLTGGISTVEMMRCSSMNK